MNPKNNPTRQNGDSDVNSTKSGLSLYSGKSMKAIAIGLTAFIGLAHAVDEPVDKNSSVEEVDTFIRENLSDLDSKVRSTLMFGGSAPVSFMGEARLHIQNHELVNYSDWMEADKTWTNSNWAGNSSLLRIGMVAKPHRSAVLWAKLGFQHTLPGVYTNSANNTIDGYKASSTRHDKGNEEISIQEDMSAGIAIRTKPASFWLKMGNVLWTEASPLTIWKKQPRTFAWDYLPFEVEQPIQRYYEYNIVKGEKSGRSAWNKKPFNGIQFESIDLPGNLYFNFLFGTYERYDNQELDYYDFSGDNGYTDVATEAKGRGTGDSYRHMIHTRLAYKNPESGTIIGGNYVTSIYKDDIFANENWYSKFNGPSYQDVIDSTYSDTLGRMLYRNETTGWYKTFTTASLDAKYKFNDKLKIHTDVGFSKRDTTFITKYTYDQEVFNASTGAFGFVKDAPDGSKVWTKPGNPKFAAYASIESEYGIPVKLDLAYIHPKFYSPWSFVSYNDAFMPFSSNMVGAGKFMGRGEGSPYVQNMTGAQVTINPDIGYGHFRMAYGYHFQIEESRDFLYMPFRLHGADMHTFFESSYTRWGNDYIYTSTDARNKFYPHLGDESYVIGGGKKKAPFITDKISQPFLSLGSGPQSGGITSDFLSLYEGFMAFESVEQAEANVKEATDLRTEAKNIPKNIKSTFNLELDAAYDIADLVSSPKDILVGLYASLNGVNKGHAPFQLGDDAMLTSFYFRIEPAVAVTKSFYVLGLFGFENWKTSQSYMWIPKLFNMRKPLASDEEFAGDTDAFLTAKAEYDEAKDIYDENEDGKQWGTTVNVPIDYRDFAYGFGFDWDFSPRVGLHGRMKWFSRVDEGLNSKKDEIEKLLEDNDSPLSAPDHDFDGWILSGEIKMWF